MVNSSLYVAIIKGNRRNVMGGHICVPHGTNAVKEYGIARTELAANLVR
jgi:hypothetical protein